MLALFSLLAVTYVIAASSSRQASQSMRVRANNSSLTVQGAASSVTNSILRGTNDQTSPFYMNDLFGDVYGPNPIRSKFGSNNATVADPWHPEWCTRIASGTTDFVKVTLNASNVVNGPLSDLENEYNSRILTVLEGPLAGQSFRILKYVGYVRGTPTANPDKNIGDPNSARASEAIPLPWVSPNYTDASAVNTSYSVLIDLQDVVGERFTGQIYNQADILETVSLTLAEWIAKPGLGVENLFFLKRGTSYDGYAFLINDAAFNNAGIGLNDSSSFLGFGSIDATDLMRIPSNTTRYPKVSPAFLTNYDYLNKVDYMATAVPGINQKRRQADGEVLLNGASNEGIDVPDWRDAWLSHLSDYVDSSGIGQRNIIPSFHRPEVINHIAHLFGNPQDMNSTDAGELLRLIDASTARIQRYKFGMLQSNPGFRADDKNNVIPFNFTWSSPPTNDEVIALQAYVRNQIVGVNAEWDVDNDRDGIKEGVFMNAGLPPVYAPDGRMLKAVASVHIEDLDSRINLNTAGDRSQGIPGFGASGSHLAFKPKSGTTGSHPLSQGFGYGPADISLTSLFEGSPSLLESPLISRNYFSFFDERYGARRYTTRPITFGAGNLDRVPGRRGNDPFGQFFERELHMSYRHGSASPGMPIARRSSVAAEVDLNGNLAFVHPIMQDASPSSPAIASAFSETDDDAYESSVMSEPISDDPIGLDELAAVLLRYEGNANSMSTRLTDKLRQIPGYTATSAVNRLVTARSAELRYPNLTAAAKTTATYGGGSSITIDQPLSSLLAWVKALHAQQYQNRTLPAPASPTTVDDPELTYRAIEELFPLEFTRGLRMDLNRPFGNGFDDDEDGQIDEPQELQSFSQSEQMAAGFNASGQVIWTNAMGDYRRGLQLANGAPLQDSRARLGSRQLLARNLYCLAQLIIPRNYVFPGMTDGSINLTNARIRAAAIAQWAVNVVDFRDTDSAMTRFEYDILPFGCGTSSDLTGRPAYWAPNHLDASVNGITNKDYVGVVWGMEMPELLLTESLALHDMRVRDTDLESAAGSLYEPNDPMKDQDFDQYRFPLASLFLELYCPRTTDSANVYDVSATLPASIILPGTATTAASASTVHTPITPSPGLYTFNAENQVVLDLGKMAPNDNVYGGTWGRQPVWRIAISEYDRTNGPDKKSPEQLQTLTHQFSDSTLINGTTWPGTSNSPDSVTGNGLHYDLKDRAATNPTVFERFVLFSNTAPTTVPDLKTGLTPAHSVYYNRTVATPVLKGGSYLVVGPRAETPIGSATANPISGAPWTATLERSALTAPTPPTAKQILSNSFQKIEFNNGLIETTLNNGARANDPWISRIKAPVFLACATEEPVDPAADWSRCFPDGVGLNISLPEPVRGAGLWSPTNCPLSKLNSLDENRGANGPGFGDSVPDSWIDVGPAAVVGNLKNHPFDMRQDSNAPPILNTEIAKLSRDDPQGTHENIRAAYLQRLADPEIAYHPISNPYITVDWISLDLHVFNGESGIVPMGAGATPPVFKFESRYKNGSYAITPFTNAEGTTTGFSYHSPITPELQRTQAQTPPGPPAQGSYFMHQLGYRTPIAAGWDPENLGNCGVTLGYVNAGNTRPGAPRLTETQMNETTGLHASLMDGFGPPISQVNIGTLALPVLQNVLPPYLGTSKNISSVAWFNRPFATPYELMMVPSVGPGQFGLYHSAFATGSSTFRSPFNFLPSFQKTNAVAFNDGTPTRSYWRQRDPTTPVEADFQLLLELIESEPPFAYANRVVNMTDINNMLTANVGVTNRFVDSYSATLDLYRGTTLRTPYNKIPSYVAAGKINLNTISQFPDPLAPTEMLTPALKAIENNYLANSQRGSSSDATHRAMQQQFYSSRRGYAPAASAFFGAAVHSNMNPNYPTQFAGAYRPASSSNIAPWVADDEARARLRGRYGVETTLMRSLNSLSYNPAAVPIDDQAMLFTNPAVTVTPSDLTNQHALKRMDRVMRLPNLVTNQSNVFAVWVTVSLYEYDPINGFGNEYADELGLPKRERMFYIIDRTVPVGYKPGENLNTDRAILYKRKLE